MKINDLDYSESLTEAQMKMQGGLAVEVSTYAQASGDSYAHTNTVTSTKVFNSSLLDGRGYATAISYDSAGDTSAFATSIANIFGKTNFLAKKRVKTSTSLGRMSTSSEDITVVGARYFG